MDLEGDSLPSEVAAPAAPPLPIVRAKASQGLSPVTDLRHATKGSAGLDLITSESMEFQFPMVVYKISTQHKGPIPSQNVGIILPRSSTHKKGLFVVPGVIDSDYTGPLIIQAWSNIPQTLPSGESIAQLILLPLCQLNAEQAERKGGFGSTRVAAITTIGPERPHLQFKVGGQLLTGLADTGADVSVIATKHWPSALPTAPVQDLWGIGGYEQAQRSVLPVTFESVSENSKTIQLRPYIMPLPFSIWGRDLLQQIDAKLQTNL